MDSSSPHASTLLMAGISALLLLASTSCGNGESSPTSQESGLLVGFDSAPLAGNGAILRIEGMTCENCARTVVRAMEEVPGVKSAHVGSSEEGRLEVEFDAQGDHPSALQIAQAVERAGFRALEFE